MTNRNPLRNIIREAWEDLIEKDYEKARINSERGLQAAMWSRLDHALRRKTRRLFIEPRLVSHREPGHCTPDIVICNTHSVIGVIELKDLPRGNAKWQKDVKTLQWIAEKKADIPLLNERYRGETIVQQYKFAADILYCWAGIHKTIVADLENRVDEKFRRMFFALQHQTNE